MPTDKSDVDCIRVCQSGPQGVLMDLSALRGASTEVSAVPPLNDGAIILLRLTMSQRMRSTLCRWRDRPFCLKQRLVKIRGNHRIKKVDSRGIMLTHYYISV